MQLGVARALLGIDPILRGGGLPLAGVGARR